MDFMATQLHDDVMSSIEWNLIKLMRQNGEKKWQRKKNETRKQ